MGDYFSTPEPPSDEKPKYEKPKRGQKVGLNDLYYRVTFSRRHFWLDLCNKF